MSHCENWWGGSCMLKLNSPTQGPVLNNKHKPLATLWRSESLPWIFLLMPPSAFALEVAEIHRALILLRSPKPWPMGVLLTVQKYSRRLNHLSRCVCTSLRWIQMSKGSVFCVLHFSEMHTGSIGTTQPSPSFLQSYSYSMHVLTLIQRYITCTYCFCILDSPSAERV